MKIILSDEQFDEVEKRFKWYISLRVTDFDWRVAAVSKVIDFKNMSVLDVGTFEGHIASSLSELGANVTTIDCRLGNLTLAFARIFALGQDVSKIKFKLGDIEKLDEGDSWDIIFHSGTLYHLHNPVEHLFYILPYFTKYLILETHTANPNNHVIGQIEKFDTIFTGCWFRELGIMNSLSAKDTRDSFWLDHTSMNKLFDICKLRIKETIYLDKPFPAGPRSCWILEKQ